MYFILHTITNGAMAGRFRETYSVYNCKVKIKSWNSIQGRGCIPRGMGKVICFPILSRMFTHLFAINLIFEMTNVWFHILYIIRFFMAYDLPYLCSWIRDQQKSEGVTPGEDVYIILRLDGQVRRSGKVSSGFEFLEILIWVLLYKSLLLTMCNALPYLCRVCLTGNKFCRSCLQ